MADLEFYKKLSEQLNEELQRFNDVERIIARLYFRLEGGYTYSPAEVAKLVRRNPDEVTFIIGKILDHLQQKELLHALPRRLP
jgi:DNA mismatch repair ATPase MutS